MRFGGWEIPILLVIALLLLGPSRLPRLGRALDRMLRGLRKDRTQTMESPAMRTAGKHTDPQDRG